jgi:hypothetical protein
MPKYVYAYVIEGQNLTWRFSLGKTDKDIVCLQPNSPSFFLFFIKILTIII